MKSDKVTSVKTTPNRWVGRLPKVGIRPTIDGRYGGVRESLEGQTMGMAKAAAKLITDHLRYPNGAPVECVIADRCIGGAAEAAMAADKFQHEGVGVSLTVTPCWCYGSETMDMVPLMPKAVWGFNGTERPGAVYLARRGGQRIAFFFRDQPVRQLTRGFEKIRQTDRGRFRLLGVLVAPTTAEVQRLRAANQADRFPRAFFASEEELREVASLMAPVPGADGATEIGRHGFTGPEPAPAGKILAFQAEVLANTAIGGPPSAHYRLAFRAPRLQDVQPPQFVMMDTAATGLRLGARAVRRGSLRGAVDLEPRPLLKRPFGICRDFHRHFPVDYVRRLELPPTLALGLHIAAPDHFDVLYKVLPNGIGTTRMTQLRRGQKVHMLGPLGRPYDVRRLRAEGVEEVHVIGGGVGMAPLILLVESLRYYSFKVKVFLGIQKLESLRYRDELAATFGEKSRDAYVYVDDLLAAGVPPADLYVACDSEAPATTVRGIPAANLYRGLVPDQYRRFLEHRTGAGGEAVRAFTCGPNRMMEIVAEMAQQAGLRLHVLLEKRMACGLGVCFSCVCPVRRPDGRQDYARICTEGPLFDAKDILWKIDDSKSPSAGSSCAAPC